MRRAEARPGSLRSTRSLRVLLVEDEALLSLELESIVGDWGHEVVGSAATAGNALRLAQEKRPEIILMNINLGGPVDGISAALQICTFLDVQMIFMTGYSVQDLSARMSGFNFPVLHKPLSPDRLFEALQRRD